MPTLQDLLDEAAGRPRPFDASADLQRCHRALARRRIRRYAGAAGGLVAAGALAFAALPHGSGSVDTLRPSDGGSSSPTGTPTPSAEVNLQFYEVPRPPTGWHVVGDRPQYVMITRDGSGVTSIDSGFVGQIVVMLSPGDKSYDVISRQQSLEYDGRTFYANGEEGGSGMTTVSVRTAGGDWLQIQYPASDFSVRDMVTYLDGVVVKNGAEPGDRSTGHVAFRTLHLNGHTYIVGKDWLRRHPEWLHKQRR